MGSGCVLGNDDVGQLSAMSLMSMSACFNRRSFRFAGSCRYTLTLVSMHVYDRVVVADAGHGL